MKHVLVEFVGIADATYSTSDMKTTLDQQGIIGFRDDFLSLSTEDVTQLEPNITVPLERSGIVNPGRFLEIADLAVSEDLLYCCRRFMAFFSPLKRYWSLNTRYRGRGFSGKFVK